MKELLSHIFQECYEHKKIIYNTGNLSMYEYGLSNAMCLIDLGYYIFPVRRNKMPYYKFSWNTLSTNDKKVAQEYWKKYPNSMIAIDCRKSGIVVIDVDEKTNKNKFGHNTLKECFEQWGNLDKNMPIVISASGGLHIYAKDCGIKYINCYKDCIDIRQPHYIIVPTSINENGGLYKMYNRFVSVDELISLPASWSDGLKSASKSYTNTCKNFEKYKKKVKDIDVTSLFDKCEFLKTVRDDSEILSEPLWFQFAIWCSGIKNGNEIFHEYSADYPDYSYEQAEAKFQNASKYYFNCKNVKDVFDGCTNCKLKKGDNNDGTTK